MNSSYCSAKIEEIDRPREHLVHKHSTSSSSTFDKEEFETQFPPIPPGQLGPYQCNFCLKAGEPPEIYTSHMLRRNGTIVCPKLKVTVI